MISPSSLQSFTGLAAAAAELVRGQTAPAPRSAGAARATFVPSGGNLPEVLGGKDGGALARALRSSRGTRTARKARASRSSAGYATSKSKKKSSASASLSFLKDPKLSIEEKLIRLLGYLNAKWDKEMQDRLDKIGAGEGAKASGTKSSGGKKKKGGLLGGLGGVLAGALGPAGIALEALKVPAVRSMLAKIGGPVLAAGATALGFPQVAPLLLKHGPKLVELAAGVVSKLDGAAGGPESESKASSSGGSKAVSDSERQTLLMEIQRIQQKQQEMFGLVSNILKSNHDVRSAIIGNIR